MATLQRNPIRLEEKLKTQPILTLIPHMKVLFSICVVLQLKNTSVLSLGKMRKPAPVYFVMHRNNNRPKEEEEKGVIV
jgi:hypothetical protein